MATRKTIKLGWINEYIHERIGWNKLAEKVPEVNTDAMRTKIEEILKQKIKSLYNI